MFIVAQNVEHENGNGNVFTQTSNYIISCFFIIILRSPKQRNERQALTSNNWQERAPLLHAITYVHTLIYSYMWFILI